MQILDEPTEECAFQLVKAHTYPGSEILTVPWDKYAGMAEDGETRIFSPDFLQYDPTSFVESVFENGLQPGKRVQALLDEKMWRERWSPNGAAAFESILRHIAQLYPLP